MIISEHLTPWTYLEIVVYVAIYWKVFAFLAKKASDPLFLRRWGRWDLNLGTTVGIANLIVSAMFGLGASTSGFVILNSRLRSSSPPESDGAKSGTEAALGLRNDFVTRAMLASIGYFIYDLWAMFKVHSLKLHFFTEHTNGHTPEQEKLNPNRLIRFYRDLVSFLTGRPLMICHHVVMAFVFIPLILIRRDHEPGDILIACTFLLETSTPFVALRTILSDLSLNKSVLYLVNGIVMLNVFFFCRILVYPFFYYVYGLSAGLTFIEAILKTPWYCAIGMVVSFLPQVYWFKLMFKGAVKMVTTRGHGHGESAKLKRN